MSSRLIVFEGVDAVGKTAIAHEYAAKLRAHGLCVRLLSFPGCTEGTLGSLVYRLHHNRQEIGIDRLTATSLQAVHVAAHIDTIEAQILPALSSGETVVLDRFWWSTWVYGAVDFAQMGVINALIDAERFAWGECSPYALFHVCRSRPLRDEPLERWSLIQQKYTELRQREGGRHPIYILDNEGTLQETVEDAFEITYGQAD